MKTTIRLGVVAAVGMAICANGQLRSIGGIAIGKPAVAPTPAGTSGYSAFNYWVTNVQPEDGQPMVPNTRFQLAVKYPPSGVTIKDIVTFTSGHDGSAWMSSQGDHGVLETRLGLGVSDAQMIGWLDRLVGEGHVVVLLRWTSNGGWCSAPLGQVIGLRRLGVYPATACKYIYDTIAAPAGVPMKLVGNSAGTAQELYSLIDYGFPDGSGNLVGIDELVAVAICDSGPPYSYIAEGCTQQAGFAGSPSWCGLAGDHPNGFPTNTGPCVAHSTDPNWYAWWQGDGVRFNRSITTQLHFIKGGHDSYPEITHREDLIYAQALSFGVKADQTLLATQAHGFNQDTLALIEEQLNQ